MHPTERDVARASCALSALLLLAFCAPAGAATLRPVHRFMNTGNSTRSHYALGSSPSAELVQASDGNFYGTTTYGGSGGCVGEGGAVQGCGTVFRMTPQGAVTSLYSFPYDAATNSAANGAYPTAGLIQAKDGYLYGAAQDGGLLGCNGALGCGTLFRISTAGVFKRLHQFCSGDGCPNPSEGGRPMAHLVQKPGGGLCGTTAEGGSAQNGTVFCATTGGAVTTLYVFHYENGTDGYNPVAALLVGQDGETLYGTTVLGGMNGGASGGGTVFALKGAKMTILHAFDDYQSSTPGTYYDPKGALIFGADGKLYSTTEAGGSGGGCIFSLNTDGTGFAVRYDFNADASSNAPGFPVAGLVLAADGMMYGTTLSGSIEQTYGLDNGIAFRYNPAKGVLTKLADFNGTVGANPTAAFVEGTNKNFYTTATLYGGSNTRGTDAGSVVLLAPALKE